MAHKLYEGKAKQIFSTEDPGVILVHYKDDATAFNGIKKAQIENKGILNNAISSLLYQYLNKEGIPTHYLETINESDQLCKRVDIIPLEVIVRNIAAGSFSKRLAIEEGSPLKQSIFEICYKNDALGDPLINDDHAIAIGLCTKEQLQEIRRLTYEVNRLLLAVFDRCEIDLVDFKIEFGIDQEGKVILADEISPDSCRLWDKHTHEKLDKDRFRRDLGKVQEAYQEILSRLKGVLNA